MKSIGNVTEELVPRYDSCKSFYGKAVVRKHDDYSTLVSYKTDVAVVKFTDNKFSVQVLEDVLTPTTLRHVKEFLKQHGIKAVFVSSTSDEFLSLIILSLYFFVFIGKSE